MAHITSITGTLKDNTGTEVEFVITTAGDDEPGAYFTIKTISETVKNRGMDWVDAITEALDHDGYFNEERF